MQFVNQALLFGGMFMAVPIVLHLVMRQQPKQLEFPALRFLRRRREANRRRLRLKHLLLLILRCAVIAALAAALARPSVASSLMGNWVIIAVLAGLIVLIGIISAVALGRPATRLVGVGTGVLGIVLLIVWLVLLFGTWFHDPGMTIGDRQAPVAAVLIFDTSPRMEYRRNDRSRLDEAKELADWLIHQLPDESEVAVVSSRARGRAAHLRFAVDLGAAKAAVEALRTTSVPAPLPEVVTDAVTWLGGRGLATLPGGAAFRPEIYVFTDLTAAAWDVRAAGRRPSELADKDVPDIYLIDVGVERPRNFALGDLRLSAETLSKNAELTIQTEIFHHGPGDQRAVELYLERRDDERPILVDGEVLLPDAQRRSFQSFNVARDGSQMVQFTVQGLEAGTTQGRVQIVGQDNLPIDDVRHFTISVNDAWPVLVVRGVGADSRWLVEALSPYEFRKTERARFRPEVVLEEELPERELANYDAVCLLDPGNLPAGTIRRLTEYVRSGGSLAVFLGRNARPDAMNADAMQELLPGRLDFQWPKRRDFQNGPAMSLAPRDYQHSILAAFRPVGTSVPWQAFPVHRFWKLKDIDDDARVLVQFNIGKPAILEQIVGDGRVLTMTTPVSDAANVADRPAWNRLATGLNAWPFLLLSRGMLSDLVKSGDERLNYLAGQQATLRRRSPTEPDTYLLFSPLGERPEEVSADDDLIAVNTTTAVGAYRMKAKGGGFPVRGFCVNLPKTASLLERATSQQLDEAIGAGRYRKFRSRDEIEPGISEVRQGREFFASLLVAVALLLAMEHTLANRFYPKRADVAGSTIESFREGQSGEAA